MIELRFVKSGYFNGFDYVYEKDLQYRHMIFTCDASGAMCPPDPKNMWSEWKNVEEVYDWEFIDESSN